MLLDGRFVANTITTQLKQRINVLKIQNINIGLGVILVGLGTNHAHLIDKHFNGGDHFLACHLNLLFRYVGRCCQQERVCPFLPGRFLGTERNLILERISYWPF